MTRPNYRKLERQLSTLPPQTRKRVLAEIRRIERIRWFRYNPNIDWRKVKRIVNEITDSLGLPRAEIERRGARTQREWQDVWGTICAAGRDIPVRARWRKLDSLSKNIARATKRKTTQNIAMQVGQAVVRDTWKIPNLPLSKVPITWGIEHMMDDAQGDISVDIAWEVVSDLPEVRGKTNPFKKLVDLYEMGLYPVGIVSGKFIIYVPTKPTRRKTSPKKKTLKIGESKRTTRLIKGEGRRVIVKRTGKESYSVRVVSKRGKK